MTFREIMMRAMQEPHGSYENIALHKSPKTI